MYFHSLLSLKTGGACSTRSSLPSFLFSCLPTEPHFNPHLLHATFSLPTHSNLNLHHQAPVLPCFALSLPSFPYTNSPPPHLKILHHFAFIHHPPIRKKVLMRGIQVEAKNSTWKNDKSPNIHTKAHVMDFYLSSGQDSTGSSLLV